VLDLSLCFDLCCYCHTQESIAHALQAGDKQLVVLFRVPVKGHRQEDAVNSAQAVVCQPCRRIIFTTLLPYPGGNHEVQLCPFLLLHFTPTTFLSHMSACTHSSRGSFTDTHLEHCVGYYSSAGSHLDTEDIGSREKVQTGNSHKWSVKCQGPSKPPSAGAPSFYTFSQFWAVKGRTQGQGLVCVVRLSAMSLSCGFALLDGPLPLQLPLQVVVHSHHLDTAIHHTTPDHYHLAACNF
jgi:hypothetical protein